MPLNVASRLGFTGDVAFIGEISGGAHGHGRAGGQGQEPRPSPARTPWKKGRLAAAERGHFSAPTTSRVTSVAFRWLDRRTATQIGT